MNLNDLLRSRNSNFDKGVEEMNELIEKYFGE